MPRLGPGLGTGRIYPAGSLYTPGDIFGGDLAGAFGANLVLCCDGPTSIATGASPWTNLVQGGVVGPSNATGPHQPANTLVDPAYGDRPSRAWDSIDDYLATADTNFLTGVQQISIFIVRKTTLDGATSRTVFSQGDGAGTCLIELLSAYSSGGTTYGARVFTYSSAGIYLASRAVDTAGDPPALADCFVIDRSTAPHTIVAYRNGATLTMTPIAGGGTVAQGLASGAFFVGRHCYSGSALYKGSLQHLSIVTRLVTSAEGLAGTTRLAKRARLI